MDPEVRLASQTNQGLYPLQKAIAVGHYIAQTLCLLSSQMYAVNARRILKCLLSSTKGLAFPPISTWASGSMRSFQSAHRYPFTTPLNRLPICMTFLLLHSLFTHHNAKGDKFRTILTSLLMRPYSLPAEKYISY